MRELVLGEELVDVGEELVDFLVRATELRLMTEWKKSIISGIEKKKCSLVFSRMLLTSFTNCSRFASGTRGIISCDSFRKSAVSFIGMRNRSATIQLNCRASRSSSRMISGVSRRARSTCQSRVDALEVGALVAEAAQHVSEFFELGRLAVAEADQEASLEFQVHPIFETVVVHLLSGTLLIRKCRFGHSF